MNNRKLIVAVVGTLLLAATLFMVTPIRSSPKLGEVNPWADLNDDGVVDIFDAITLANAFEKTGPFINKTALLDELAALKRPIKIGLILARGGLGDKSFNDLAYAGMVRAKAELNITFTYSEPASIADYEDAQRGYASDGGYALIVCIGFEQADALNSTAAAYPNQKFAIVDMVVSQSNVASLLFKANEGSFLTGVLAGMLTNTGKVGFVGGMDIPLIRDFYVGYKAGAEWANSSVTVLDPLFVGGWADPAVAREEALTLIVLGADGIFAAAGKSGLGALLACNESNVNGFGVDSCQDYLYTQIRGSATKRVDNAVFEIVKAAVISKLLPNLQEGGFEGGVHSGGLAEKWVGCSRLPEEEAFWEQTFDFLETPLPANVVTKLTEARDEIISGNITVPSGYT
jgi:basic membrane protein A